MKKIIIPILALVIASCGGGNNNQTQGGNTNADPKATESQSATASETAAPKKLGDFLTQDLRMHNFFGKVKTAKTTIYDCGADQKPLPDSETYEDYYVPEYDADGHFKTYIDVAFSVSGIKKKDGDRILEAEEKIADFGDQPINAVWTYNANNQVKTYHVDGIEGRSDEEYFYNAEGELTKVTSEASGEGEMTRTTTSYKILARDANGNWTERFATIESEDGSWDDAKQDFANFQKRDTRYELHKREIQYY